VAQFGCSSPALRDLGTSFVHGVPAIGASQPQPATLELALVALSSRSAPAAARLRPASRRNPCLARRDGGSIFGFSVPNFGSA
jgi:hypothetical protein